MTNTKSRRWTHAVITAAAAVEMDMPWARGERRAAMIRRRETKKAGGAPHEAQGSVRTSRAVH